MEIEWKNIIGLRMERQCLTRPAGTEEYDRLYRDMQPGQNVYWHGFGEPPVLSFRADFDDKEYNHHRQLERKLIKGRFQGGNLGWLCAEDIEVFACMCRKPLADPAFEQAQLLELIRRQGPLNIQQIKEETGWLVKQITPLLHRLQEAFLIYEDQYDGEWDRGWYRFEEMFPEVNLERFSRVEAMCRVLPGFVYRMVWVDAAMVKSFYRLPVKDVKAALDELAARGVLVEHDGGYLRCEDVVLLKDGQFIVPDEILVLHRNDILVKSSEEQLKKSYYDGKN